ncbi:hypothetical protein [Methylobacterium sp. 37f]|uniref:hypothetical protein n=1 Tax=Methylobacterium sp. 37f TaxID=2817058 RepID=UPI001FFCBDBC|nr:hypothetical protein [Methylobacterium sp. 37f]MCK2055310.1 hypothetical protein [Methylobacterium sp. 37f]
MPRTRTDIPARDTPEAKARRQPKRDLSRLDAEAKKRRDLVEMVGFFAFRDSWKSRLAEALTHCSGRKVSPAQVLSWSSGARPVPADLMPALEDVAYYEARSLRSMASILDGLSAPDRLRPEPEPEPEAKPAPAPQVPGSPEWDAHIEAVTAELMECDDPTE